MIAGTQLFMCTAFITSRSINHIESREFLLSLKTTCSQSLTEAHIEQDKQPQRALVLTRGV